MKFFKTYKRKIIQTLTLFLYNINFKGFRDANIYTGDLKKFCVPGLNCYSCPGSIGACPLGILQTSILNSKYKIPILIFGIILFFGILLGRIICGFLCPFGFLQELIYKIKTKKIKKNKITKKFTILKYIILIIFVLLIPIILNYPGFCKYICPVGTIEGGIPLTTLNENLKNLRGFLFNLKFTILIIILISSIFIFRFFCKFLCPLGAIYSMFNKISFFNIVLDEKKCINCNKCIEICPMDIKKVGDRECVSCTKCINICPTKAIKLGKRY